MASDAYVRAPENEADWKRFEALNFATFFESVPPYEKMSEKEFRKQHKDILKRYSPRNKDRGALLIAANDNSAYLGHCWLGAQTDFFTNKVVPWVFDLTVAPEFRGQGFGRLLMDECIFRCRALGYSTIGLQVMAHNVDAERFYKRYGFFVKASSMAMHVSGGRA